jgi:hypothetical protein
VFGLPLAGFLTLSINDPTMLNPQKTAGALMRLGE